MIHQKNMTLDQHIHTTLKRELSPTYLEVINESFMHHVPKGSESHFKVIIVSDKFEGLKLIKRHQLINKFFMQDFAEKKFHALSLLTYTPKEWSARGETVLASPKCLGGSKHN